MANMRRSLLLCVLFSTLSACVSMPDSVQIAPATRLATNTSTLATISKTPPLPRPTIPSIATVDSSTPTRLPKIDPAEAGTQAVATVEPARIVWNGSISSEVFRQVIDQEPKDRDAFVIPKSNVVFNVFTRPMILAAYIYEVPMEEKFHARFLLYERGGKWGEEVVPPFLYKMDLPLSWIGGHEDYGKFNELTRNLKAQFENPIVPNKLRIGVFSANTCTDARDVYQQLCVELARQDIQLPVDYEYAEALVMDQWDLAIQRTATEVANVEQMVSSINTIRTDWWEDDRFVLFYLPPLTVCLPEDQTVCGTYISYEMMIDTFGLLRQ